jgi:hypothetical protein
MDGMQNLMNIPLADSFAADAERRWLYGHPYGVERRRRDRPVRARARRPLGALRRLRAA